VHDSAALDPGRDDERGDPVRVDVVGTVLESSSTTKMADERQISNAR
jgi:hypothetical protein